MSARTTLEAAYWMMRRRLVPTLQGSQDIYEGSLKSLLNPNCTWLDIGCGHQVLPEWRAEAEPELMVRCEKVIGIDYDFPSLKQHRSISLLVRGDVSRLPFEHDSFDLVTANMVVEHLNNPVVQFEEISRVLKPGGLFLFHTPNAHGYFSLLRRVVPNLLAKKLVALLDGRRAEDVFPVQYKANTQKRIAQLAETTGLEVAKTRMVVSEAVFQIVPPFAFLELLWIRILMTDPLKRFRTNIIAILRKSSR